ncbi:hypothetical protein [Actinomadura oligospora]|uniref:hypothetical protein n=1 Tax=Actinomadura oligospora TaxID=111804 RepID=UPI00047CD704|nr:hypothetical protein [Actinomadura oligospora]
MARRSIALLGAVSAAAFTAITVAQPAQAADTRHGRVIYCEHVYRSGYDDLIGRECATWHWGPLHHFVLVRAGTYVRYFCERGWAEGSLWVRGHDCRRIWWY